MSIIAIIPARYNSTRFPGKPLAMIKEKPMIQWVYESVLKVNEIKEVYVATDDIRIKSAVESFGGKAIITSKNHKCGTDRLAECVEILDLKDKDIILNIQGDEPLIKEEMIRDLISVFDDSTIYMGSLKKRIENKSELTDPNVVKVVTDRFGYALYFSRYCIPYERNANEVFHYKHVGVYGYTKEFLLKYSTMSMTSLESIESLEQLRVLENGYKIYVKETQHSSIGVDTPDQLKMVEKELMRKQMNG